MNWHNPKKPWKPRSNKESWEEPLAQWENLKNLRPLILNQVMERTITLALNRYNLPALVFDKPVSFSWGDTLEATALFSVMNTKMSSVSWDLPAGGMGKEGTCFAQQFQDAGKLPDGRPVTNKFVCAFCYAGKGQQAMENVQFGQMTRLVWVDSQLSASYESYVSHMVDAIEYVQNHAPKTCHPKFFRIHSSGDFHSLEYMQSWIDIASKMGHIHFWAPTRTWIHRDYAALAATAPQNLVIRPSALVINDPPPQPTGALGSTVNLPFGKYGEFVTDVWPEHSVWICPAYRKEKKDLASCENQHCRQCWFRKTEVSYSLH